MMRVKKRKNTKKVLIFATLSVLLLAFAVVLAVNMSGKCFTKGRCVVSDAGSVLWINENGSPIQLLNRSDDGGMFDDISTGDEIYFLRDVGIMESYPGRVGVYYLKKLSDGGEDSIPSDVLEDLRELGWLK